MSQTNLLQLVRNDVDAFLQSNDELFFNERDFQMHLALWLKESANEYDDVDLEYNVPKNTLDGYVWNSELRLDIVIRKGDEYLPVELKYKTKSIIRKKFLRFGEDINANVDEPYEIMKNQGAQDLGMYEFWKDIRRIECVRNRFEKVVGGLAIFLTNDLFYQKPNKDASNNYNFSMHNGTHSTCKHWQRQTSTTKDYPDFDLDNEHNIQWQGTKVESVDMYYCIVAVEGLTQQTITMEKIKVIGKTQNGAALGVMKAYAELNSNTTLEGMRKAFPNDIAPDKGVKEMFLPLNEAEAFNQEHNMSLYFTKDGKPIQLKDCEIAMSQIWTGKSLQNLINVAAKYGIEVEVNKEAKEDFGKMGYVLVFQNDNKTENKKSLGRIESTGWYDGKKGFEYGFGYEVYFEEGDGYIIEYRPENNQLSIEYSFATKDKKKVLCDLARMVNFKYDPNWDIFTFGKNICKGYGVYDDLRKIGQYEISVELNQKEKIEDDERVILSRKCENSLDTMRKIAEKIGFEYDVNWTTQQFAPKLGKEISKYEWWE